MGKEPVQNSSYVFKIPEIKMESQMKNERSALKIDRIFVYGTLMRGQCRDHVLDFDDNIISIETGQTNGLLYDLGEFPGMVLSPGATNTVTGEVFHVQDVKKSLSVLDEIEGFGGYGAKESLYIRTIVTVNDAAGNNSPAWCYLFNQHDGLDKRIESGNWKTRHELT